MEREKQNLWFNNSGDYIDNSASALFSTDSNCNKGTIVNMNNVVNIKITDVKTICQINNVKISLAYTDKGNPKTETVKSSKFTLKSGREIQYTSFSFTPVTPIIPKFSNDEVRLYDETNNDLKFYKLKAKSETDEELEDPNTYKNVFDVSILKGTIHAYGIGKQVQAIIYVLNESIDGVSGNKTYSYKCREIVDAPADLADKCQIFTAGKYENFDSTNVRFIVFKKIGLRYLENII